MGLLGANGKLPSLAKATKVGEELELQKEAKVSPPSSLPL